MNTTTNQTVVTSENRTVRNVEITNISYKGFWTYGTWNGQPVKTYEGWNSWVIESPVKGTMGYEKPFSLLR